MLSGKISASAWRGLFLFALLLGLLFCFGLVGDFGKAEAEAGRGAGIAKPEEVIEIEGRNNVWSGEKVIEEAVVIKEGALLRIQKGTTIKFKREEGRPAPFILIEDGGLLVANGTEKDWIKFTSDQEKSAFSLIFEGSNRGKGFSGYLRYAQISKAGGVYEYEAEPSQQVRRSFPLVPKALAQEKETKKEERFPIHHLGGNLLMENCRFFDNRNTDVFISGKNIHPDNFSFRQGELVQIINSNFEGSQQDAAIRSDFDCGENNPAKCEELFLLKNNWYGSPFGPDLVDRSWQYYDEHQDTYISPSGQGKKVVGKHLGIEGFRAKDLIADPLIIIPGFMGSAEEMIGNDLVMDPILHSYDELIDSLQDNGYQKGVNLFTFPYNWRNSNVMTAGKLSEKIKEVKKETGAMYVDLAAHSMGGLVARSYIQGKSYGYEVDQLITLGTPHRGSPKAYLMWEGGEGFFTWKENLIKHHYSREAKHNDYDDLFSYIRNEVHSVRELLPDYDYLYDVGKEEMREYPEDYPRNYFLEEINQPNSIQDFRENRLVRFTNIVGKMDEDRTITGLKVEASGEVGSTWENGRPEDFGDKGTDQGLEFGRGDETVPYESANGIPADQAFEIKSVHIDLPTTSQCRIFKTLSGKENCDYDTDLNITNVFLFNVHSPVDIQVVSPSGKIVGKDFESGEAVNEVELAYYSGFDTQDEFVTIPNFEEGEYKIKTQGTGEGDFRIEAVSFVEDEDGEVEDKVEKVIEGTAVSGGEQEFDFVVESEESEESEGKCEGEENCDQSSVSGDQDENEKESRRSPVAGHQDEDNKESDNGGNEDEEVVIGDEAASDEHECESEESEGKCESGEGGQVIGEQSGNDQEVGDSTAEEDDESHQSSVTSHQSDGSAGEEENDQSSDGEDRDEEGNEEEDEDGDEDKDSEDEEDEEESHQSAVIGDQSEGSASYTAAETEGDGEKKEGYQPSAISDQDSGNEDGRNRSGQNNQEKPVVKGEKTENDLRVIAGILFAGLVALILTWTVGRGESSKHINI